MEFIKKIRGKLDISCYGMAQELGFSCTRTYQDFENSKRAVNLEKLIKLWRFSALEANEFLEMIEEEVIKKPKSKKEKR